MPPARLAITALTNALHSSYQPASLAAKIGSVEA
jgi:hypothetical protein